MLPPRAGGATAAQSLLVIAVIPVVPAHLRQRARRGSAAKPARRSGRQSRPGGRARREAGLRSGGLPALRHTRRGGSAPPAPLRVADDRSKVLLRRRTSRKPSARYPPWELAPQLEPCRERPGKAYRRRAGPGNPPKPLPRRTGSVSTRAASRGANGVLGKRGRALPASPSKRARGWTGEPANRPAASIGTKRIGRGGGSAARPRPACGGPIVDGRQASGRAHVDFMGLDGPLPERPLIWQLQLLWGYWHCLGAQGERGGAAGAAETTTRCCTRDARCFATTIWPPGRGMSV